MHCERHLLFGGRSCHGVRSSKRHRREERFSSGKCGHWIDPSLSLPRVADHFRVALVAQVLSRGVTLSCAYKTAQSKVDASYLASEDCPRNRPDDGQDCVAHLF